MFSARLAGNLSPNLLARRLAEKRAGAEPIIDLTESNPTRVGLQYPPALLAESWAAAAARLYEPDPRGLPQARQAIARYYHERLLPVAPERPERVDPATIFLTAGTSEAYAMLFKLLADPGDEILIPRPGYPLLAHLARFEALEGVYYPSVFHPQKGWTIDLEVLSALVTPRTRAIVTVNPNNPTGAYLKEAERDALDGLCRQNNLALIVDEVFSDYPAGPDPRRVAGMAGRTRCLSFVLNGFSKLLALPQVKLAWIALGGEAAMVRDAAQRLETLLDFYLSVATPVQHAAEILLDGRDTIQRQVCERIAFNRDTLQALVAGKSGCRLLPAEGGWYAILEIHDDLTDDARTLGLLEHGNTLIHPGYFYEFNKEGFVVISLLPRPEHFRTGVERLLAGSGPASDPAGS